MWSSFLFCAAFITAILYIPGFFFCRVLRLDAPLALACAPIPSIALYATLPILYGLAGVSCSWANVLVPTAVIYIALWAVLGFWHRRAICTCGEVSQRGNCEAKHEGKSSKSSREIWAILLLYVLVGLGICVYVFVKSLDGADSFHPKHDNITHYNVVRAFVDSGSWSSLTMSLYNGTGLSDPPISGSSFYPAAWHDVCAITLSALQCESAVVMNAFNAVVCGLVYPMSMFSFVRLLFPGNRGALLAGAVLAPAFTAFPWALLIKGPLYPNVLCFALVPAVLAMFIYAFGGGLAPVRQRLGFALPMGVVSFLVLAFSQPNGLFVVLVFAFFYCGPLIKKAAGTRWKKMGQSRWATALFYLLYLVAVVVVWALINSLPFLAATIGYENVGDASFSAATALFNTLSFSFFASLPQWALAVVCLVGAIVLVYRRRIWLVALALAMMFFFFLSCCTLGYPKVFFTGVWYNDPWRMAACSVLFLVPVGSFGLSVLIAWCATFLQKLGEGPKGETGNTMKRATAVSAASLLLVFSLVVYFPNHDIPRSYSKAPQTPFGQIRGMLIASYDTDREQVYSKEEQEFVRKALAEIPADAVVINQPNDGSVFAYGLDGLNAFYRSNNLAGATSEAVLIKERLADIAEDSEVQDAVKKIGAEYVLLLDQGVPFEEGSWMSEYSDAAQKAWSGLENIDDRTEGFETVLADGDMRLYKVGPSSD